jgi:hypothetical protein
MDVAGKVRMEIRTLVVRIVMNITHSETVTPFDSATCLNVLDVVQS